jgi:hypothetical protein
VKYEANFDNIKYKLAESCIHGTIDYVGKERRLSRVNTPLFSAAQNRHHINPPHQFQ